MGLEKRRKFGLWTEVAGTLERGVGDETLSRLSCAFGIQGRNATNRPLTNRDACLKVGLAHAEDH